jgi:hypothetical protein
LCSSGQPYNAREFSNLWLGIGAPTRSVPCATAQAAHPWSRPWPWKETAEAWFELQPWHFPGGTDINHVNPSLNWELLKYSLEALLLESTCLVPIHLTIIEKGVSSEISFTLDLWSHQRVLLIVC